MGAFLGILVVAIIVALILHSMKAKKVKGSHETALAQIPDFKPAVHLGNSSDTPGIALDPQSERFAILHPNGELKLFKFSQLVAVDVEKNGVSLQKTNRGSQVMGAAVGAILLGPVGLLLGGLTGSKRNVEKVRRLSIKIFTDDLISPVTEIIFFNSPSGSDPNGFLVRTAAQLLDEWHGRFLTIIQRANPGQNQNN